MNDNGSMVSQTVSSRTDLMFRRDNLGYVNISSRSEENEKVKVEMEIGLMLVL